MRSRDRLILALADLLGAGGTAERVVDELDAYLTYLDDGMDEGTFDAEYEGWMVGDPTFGATLYAGPNADHFVQDPRVRADAKRVRILMDKDR